VQYPQDTQLEAVSPPLGMQRDCYTSASFMNRSYEEIYLISSGELENFADVLSVCGIANASYFDHCMLATIWLALRRTG
jgi:hypothetical protein